MKWVQTRAAPFKKDKRQFLTGRTCGVDVELKLKKKLYMFIFVLLRDAS
jgi:hypothetical protein